MKPDSQATRPESRSAFALLIVLVAVAILLVLYAGQLSIFTGEEPFRQKKRDKAGKETMPWEEEFRLAGPDKRIALPEPPKPQLNQPISIKGRVRRNQQDRGQLILDFAPDGAVKSYWVSEYAHKDLYYAYEASTTGNIDTDKGYTDKQGSDPSLLYIITKGGYTKVTFRKGRRVGKPEQGIIYVTGWLGPDYSAFGRITITTDKSWHAEYLWSAEP